MIAPELAKCVNASFCSMAGVHTGHNVSNSRMETAISNRIFSTLFGPIPEGAEVIYALRNNSNLADSILTEIGKEGQILRKAYQRRLPSNTSKDYYFIQRDTGITQPVTIEYGFLDEGLAEYSVVLFYENHPNYGMSRENMIDATEKTFKAYCTVYDKLFGKVDTSMIRGLNKFSSEYEYVNIAYIKPCLMYEYLRRTAGDERFFKGLKQYYEKYKFKNATPYDIVGIFEKIGADTNGYFETFYLGKEII